jgi:uncharacterized membrane protein
MDAKRLVIGTIVGAVAIYFLGDLIWDVLFNNFFEANRGTATGVDREAPVLWAAFVGTLMYALAISLFLEKAKRPTNFLTGLVVGAVAGILIWGTADFTMFAYGNFRNLNATIADTLLEGVRGGVTGAVLAIIGGLVSGKKAAA